MQPLKFTMYHAINGQVALRRASFLEHFVWRMRFAVPRKTNRLGNNFVSCAYGSVSVTRLGVCTSMFVISTSFDLSIEEKAIIEQSGLGSCTPSARNLLYRFCFKTWNVSKEKFFGSWRKECLYFWRGWNLGWARNNADGRVTFNLLIMDFEITNFFPSSSRRLWRISISKKKRS